MGESVDHPGAPALSSLPGEDVPADRPVEQDQLAANGEGGPDLSVLDAALELLQQFRVAGGCLEAFFHEISIAWDLPRQFTLSWVILLRILRSK
jgi:hypothetical protein